MLTTAYIGILITGFRQYIPLPSIWYRHENDLCSIVSTATMTSARNSVYSTHSIADAHFLAILDEKQDTHQLDLQQPSRLSALLPLKLLETVFILPATFTRKHEYDQARDDEEAASFDTMQKSIQVIGLPKPEKSKPRLSHSFETEHIMPNNVAFDDDDKPEHLHYDSEPQMRYTAPSPNLLSPEYTQQGCSGYRYPNYGYGGCRRIGYGAYGNRGCAGPQRPPQCYIPGGRRQRRYGGGYYHGGGGGGCGRGGGWYGGYGGYGGRCHPPPRPILVRRHGGCCCCC
ncbi:hypothetical protein M436DRAFT_57744 [Aureobasidium namibiae CBS 147.97]|uniref:Uncharacterized protein n=1 Tax=Aureobasidium namibiae CBS 147.97 TaxID=1043004 RepID=A0A074W6G4_9PEZI|nr:uncharacterized protein M436DRAFT_57744 [Aureobasidium namibiae CBS 147.97]KEQ68715.1 hypothetical protein M436DRAFT_57744 [Aureobasidium namibiae CBS 147.97]